MKKFTIIGFIILTFAFSAFGQKTKTTVIKATKVDVADEKAVRNAFDDLIRSHRKLKC